MISKKTIQQAIIGYALACALLILLFLLSMVWQSEDRNFFLKEDGAIELATVFVYFLCIAFIAYKRKIIHLKHFFLLIIFFMLRELDFNKRFTTMGIFKSRFFISESVPVIEKVIGVMVILLLIYISVSIVYRYSKDFFIGLKKRSAVAFGALLTIIFLVVSRSIDGFARKLNEFGIIVSKQAAMHVEVAEEILELGIPIVIFLTLSAYFQEIADTKSITREGRN